MSDSTGQRSGDAPTLAGDGIGRVAATEGGKPLVRGDVVGRYVVLGTLGAGGMGVVYVAYDPELDRRVAIKLLHDSARDDDEARSRLVREAKALAKLSHPNIVAVHDVGTVGERVWLAMELVAGETMRAWLRAGPRPWREVLARMIAAGRGLVAAHAVGLVHGDFKPDNVMVGEDGRVRVMDFGLARAVGDDVDGGSVAGTVQYMSGELFAGSVADARSDQFAFCVALWEGLFGARPFTGDTVIELAANVVGGNLAAPTGGSDVPTWLRRACERGLDREPTRRWPSIEALLDAVERRHASAGRRKIAAVATCVVLAGGGVLGLRELDARRRVAACEEQGASIAEVWNPDTRAKMEAAILATDVGYASVTAEKVTPWLDRHADQWRRLRTEVCLDAPAADVLDRSLWCLDERRMQLEAIVDRLVHADAGIVQRAVEVAASLPAPTTCEDRTLLGRLPDPPVEHRDRIRATRSAIARASALGHAGKATEALGATRELLVEAESIGWPPLLAAARTQESSLLLRTGALAEAQGIGEQAYFAAANAGAWDVAATAAIQLVSLVGYDLGKTADGDAWSRHAAVAIAHAGDPAGMREAARLLSLASVRFVAGELAAAQELYERVLSIQERVHDARSPDIARTLGNLATVHASAANYAEARTLFERALAIDEEALGPRHPEVGTFVANLANADASLGDDAAARGGYERALEIFEGAYGSNHPEVAATLVNLGSLHLDSGRYAEARALFERAATIRDAVLPPDHPEVGGLLVLANVDMMTGDYALAKSEYERGLAILEKALGRTHPEFGSALSNYARVLNETGEPTKARTLFEEALAIDEKALGPTHPGLAGTLIGLVEVALVERRFAEGVAYAERALTLREAGGATPLELADARYALARPLWEVGRDRDRALTLARQARDAYRDGHEDVYLRKTQDWLDTHE